MTPAEVKRFVVVVCGGRNERLTNERAAALFEEINLPPEEVMILHGGCRGIDSDVGEWASGAGYDVGEHPAQWKEFGPMAGPLRNQYLASCADKVIAFPGGKGTASMVSESRKRGVPVVELP